MLQEGIWSECSPLKLILFKFSLVWCCWPKKIWCQVQITWTRSSFFYVQMRIDGGTQHGFQAKQYGGGTRTSQTIETQNNPWNNLFKFNFTPEHHRSASESICPVPPHKLTDERISRNCQCFCTWSSTQQSTRDPNSRQTRRRRWQRLQLVVLWALVPRWRRAGEAATLVAHLPLPRRFELTTQEPCRRITQKPHLLLFTN